MHWLDYTIVLLSILAAIGTGVWFAHKQKDTSQYFAGGGKIPAWAVGISIFATLISSVTFLAYPGKVFEVGYLRKAELFGEFRSYLCGVTIDSLTAGDYEVVVELAKSAGKCV